MGGNHLRGRDPEACDGGRVQDGTREAVTSDPHSHWLPSLSRLSQEVAEGNSQLFMHPWVIPQG